MFSTFNMFLFQMQMPSAFYIFFKSQSPIRIDSHSWTFPHGSPAYFIISHICSVTWCLSSYPFHSIIRLHAYSSFPLNPFTYISTCFLYYTRFVCCVKACKLCMYVSPDGPSVFCLPLETILAFFSIYFFYIVSYFCEE